MNAVLAPARPYRIALAVHAALVLVPSLLLIGFAIAVSLLLTAMGVVMSVLEIGRSVLDIDRAPLDWSLLRFAVLLVVLGMCAFSGARALSRLTRLIWTVLCARPIPAVEATARLRSALLYGLPAIAAASILAGLIAADGTGSVWRWLAAACISGLPLLTLFGHLYWLIISQTSKSLL